LEEPVAESSTHTIYFERPGKSNTEKTLEIARKRADELGIRRIVVATTRGETAVQASRVFADCDLVAVTHSTGFPGPDEQELTEENRQALENAGVCILTATHAMGGIGRAVRKKLGTYEVEEIIAYALRIFGEGMKVVAEISVMAADAGLIRTDEEVIAIAGTGRGADTAVVLRPAHAQQFFDLRILEVLCKPRL
jgi:hypothetical protein